MAFNQAFDNSKISVSLSISSQNWQQKIIQEKKIAFVILYKDGKVDNFMNLHML